MAGLPLAVPMAPRTLKGTAGTSVGRQRHPNKEPLLTDQTSVGQMSAALRHLESQCFALHRSG